MWLYADEEVKNMNHITSKIQETKKLINQLKKNSNDSVRMGDIDLDYDTGRLARALLIKELINKLSNLHQQYARLCRNSKIQEMSDKDINKNVIDYYV